MKKKISVHQALAEVKTYEDRIYTGISAKFVVANKKSNKNPNGMTIAQLNDKMKGALDSVKALIENKKRIKAAINQSNAVTRITIGGV